MIKKILGWGILGSILLGLLGIMLWSYGWMFIPVLLGTIVLVVLLIGIVESEFVWLLPVLMVVGVLGLIIWALGWLGVILISASVGLSLLIYLAVWLINDDYL